MTCSQNKNRYLQSIKGLDPDFFPSRISSDLGSRSIQQQQNGGGGDMSVIFFCSRKIWIFENYFIFIILKMYRNNKFKPIDKERKYFCKQNY
jgi:hypothetical protein